MKNHFKVLVCLLATALGSTSVRALDITIDKNGYAELAGGQLTKLSGAGPAITAQPFGTTASAVTFTNLAASTSYNLDFFHNSGTYGSDLSITINASGTGIESVSTSNYGFGGQQMFTGFTPGDTTLTLNTHDITFNGNNTDSLHGLTSYYYQYGQFGAYTVLPNAGPITTKAIPGAISVDNLTNAGAGNEDYQIMVNSSGMLSAVPGYEHYSLFDGSTANPITVKVHYRVESTTNILGAVFVSYQNLITNAQFHAQQDPTYPYVYEFDMSQPIGNSGQLFPDFGSNTVTSANVMASSSFNINVAGPGIVGNSGGNDFTFAPRLVHGWSGSTDIFWWNTDGSNTVATATVDGFFDGNITPLGLRITATVVPEPTSIALVTAASAFLLIRRYRKV